LDYQNVVSLLPKKLALVKLLMPSTAPQEFISHQESWLLRSQLINKLNYLNFLDIPLTVRFKHETLPRTLRLSAIPEPCQNGYGFYRWSPEQRHEPIPPQFEFQDILIEDGNHLIIIKPLHHRWDPIGGVFELPEQSQLLNERTSRRYLCSSVKVELIQNSARFTGELIDFSSSSFSARLDLVPPQSFSWIDPGTPVHLVMATNHEVFFAAQCQIIRTQWGGQTGTCVLRPLRDQSQRFKSKRHRSQRQKIQPPPSLIFYHPLTGSLLEMNVKDLSGSGVGGETKKEQESLIPGMVLRKARLVFAGGVIFDCCLQVIHTQAVSDNDSEIVTTGFALLDMPPEQHTRLLALIYQTAEPNAFINHTVDTEALWRFFFDTGFIYPEKYIHIQPRKAQILSTFQKLYTSHPSFARHFTYQKMNRVLGHMSMLRFYNRSWMIQHHAAKTTESHRAGLVVLEQIGRYINDAHRLYQSQMDYVFCIYRPENKFPSRVFGGAAISIADSHVCSRDTFAYFHLPRPSRLHQRPVGREWRLLPSDSEDLTELCAWYATQSGGLMMKAFNLANDDCDIRTLSEEYHSIGFQRERRLLTLRHQGRPIAIFVANRADFGLNMSNFTNCIQVFVVHIDKSSANVIYRALTKIMRWYQDTSIPIMMYPDTAAAAFSLASEKQYTTWVLNLDYTDRYFDYISRLLNITNKLNTKASKAVK
jgi:hypothetical protein